LATPDLLAHHWGVESSSAASGFSSLHGTLAINKYIHLSVYVRCAQTIIEMSESTSISMCTHMVQL
ncbi:hypothetical protein BAE44_0020514, partial [Dichanthelium oligosanthes]